MVGAALGVIMAIIMIHHIAIISAQVANPHPVCPGSGAPGSMPGMPDIKSWACRCGNSESVVMSHALIPSPAPVTT